MEYLTSSRQVWSMTSRHSLLMMTYPTSAQLHAIINVRVIMKSPLMTTSQSCTEKITSLLITALLHTTTLLSQSMIATSITSLMLKRTSYQRFSAATARAMISLMTSLTITTLTQLMKRSLKPWKE